MTVRAPFASASRPSSPTDPIELALRPLSARVVDEMYQDDPFWSARFGPRGKHHASQDGDFHALYLAQALHMRSPPVMVRYARWLRDVLVTRGMCSWHLEENFARLRVVVLGTDLTYAKEVAALLEEAMRALHRESGPAADVERLAGELEPAARGRVLTSYVADALATGQTASLTGYVQWRKAEREVEAMRRVLESRLAEPSLAAVRTVLATAS